MFRSLMVVPAFSAGLALAQPGSTPQERSSEPNAVTAIVILLDPDATMVKQAEAANARLLKAYPKGFSLDQTHRPHVTCLQRFVNTADLPKVYAAIDGVLRAEKPIAWKLKAYKYYYVPSGDIGLAAIAVEPTDDLIRFQTKLIAAIAPFTVKAGDKTAFATTPQEPNIEPALIDYVRDFVPQESGKNFNPHVTIGLAKRDDLDAMLKENFEVFTFSPSGLSVYQLGNFGTARKQLKSWELKS